MAVIAHTRDSTTNDSDKVVLTCPDYKVYELHTIHVVLVSTATVGNRQILLQVRDENDTLVSDFHAGAVQAASLTRHYTIGQGVYRETSFVDDSIQLPMPLNTFLLPGWDLRVADENAVDAAADDMTVNVVYSIQDHSDVKGT